MSNETIIRTHKNKNNPYFLANKALFEDARLSWRARGIMAYLLSKPDDWEVRVKDLQARGDCGRDAIRSALSELEEYGYLHRRRQNRQGGQFDWIYEIYESPALNPHRKSPSPENPSMVSPSPEKPATAEPATAEPATAEPATANQAIYQIINKPSTHELNTHPHKQPQATPSPGVSGSKHSFDVREQYAEKHKDIKNKEAWLVKSETGCFDAVVGRWLFKNRIPKLDISQCPDCQGKGLWLDPEEDYKGYQKCRHRRLTAPVQLDCESESRPEDTRMRCAPSVQDY
jgi:hypothetical protein